MVCFDSDSLDPIYTGHFSGKNFVIEGHLDFTNKKIVLKSFKRKRENYYGSSNCKDTINNFFLTFSIRILNPGEKVLTDIRKSHASGDHLSDCEENLNEKIENIKKQEVSVYDYCNFSPGPLSYKAGLKIMKADGWGNYGPGPIYVCRISLHYYCEKI